MTRTLTYAAIAICSCAIADANVFTQATAGINFAGGSVMDAYNYPGGFAGGPGYHTYGGCGNTASTCSTAFSGTTDTTGLLQSSFDSATMTAHINDDGIHGAIDGSASGYARAATASGSVGIYGTGTHNIVSGYEEGGTGSGQAGVSDVLHFKVAGADGSTVTQIPIAYTIHGSLNGSGAGAATADVDAQLSFGSANFEESASYGGPLYAPVITKQTANGWSSYTITQTAPGNFTFNGNYAITGTSADLPIAEYLTGDGGAGATSQYSQTGVVALNLGSNVTFTSDSGVFLTQTAAPEPASVGLIACGAMGLLALYRLRLRIRG